MGVEIKVPTLGESVTQATVSKWFKAAGDTVAVDEPLVELETDKVTVEVNAPTAGALASIAAPEGSVVEDHMQVQISGFLTSAWTSQLHPGRGVNRNATRQVVALSALFPRC